MSSDGMSSRIHTISKDYNRWVETINNHKLMETHFSDLPQDPRYTEQQDHVKAGNQLENLINNMSHVFLPGELEMLVVMRGMQAMNAERLKNAIQGKLAIPDYEQIPNQMVYTT